jgi:hypothetical protein
MQNAVFILWGCLEVAEHAEQTLYTPSWPIAIRMSAIEVYRLANLSQAALLL